MGNPERRHERKKKPESAFLSLIVNYCKLVQKNKLCPSKQQ